MTAFSAVYSSLTGLQGFTTALDVVSNNISNLNTLGFKQNESIFRSLGPAISDQSSGPAAFEQAIGQGVAIAGQTRNFAEGQIQSTGNPTTMAINGSGFFVLKLDGVESYTRNGQFSFDNTGHLVSSLNGARVQAVDSAGNLVDLIVDQTQVYPASATTQVKFNQSLSTGQVNDYTVNGIKVIDASGASRTLTATFTRSATDLTGLTNWQVAITDDSGVSVGSGTIAFDGTGAPSSGSNTLSVDLAASDGKTSQITLDFTDSTSLSLGTNSSLQVESSDGVSRGALTGLSFDGSGVVQLAFSNSKTKTGPQVALAGFADPQALVEAGDSTYRIPRGSNLKPVFGAAGSDGFGSIQGSSVELSNVDLGQEFASIIVLQRGYQGSSQVLNISKQLLDTLYSSLNNR